MGDSEVITIGMPAYNPITGLFVWLQSPARSVKAGQRAGAPNGRGYRVVHLEGARWREHRLAWLLVHGTNPSGDIDHINGIKDDNRIANLRLATRAENMRNVGAKSTNTTGFKGVSFNKREQKFHARIKADGRTFHIGYFHTAEEASSAYARSAIAFHGEFARIR